MKGFQPDGSVLDFVEREFGSADLGDERLNRRLLGIAANLARDPGWSIPHASGNWSETKGTYRFCSNESVTREKVLEPHIQATVARVNQEEKILAVQDTTSLNFDSHPSTQAVGRIAELHQKSLQGVLAHSCLAVTVEDHRVLGVLDQQVIIRSQTSISQERSRKTRRRERESQKWLKGIDKVVERVEDPSRLIFVFDREGDIFEAIEEAQDSGAGFVIRAAYSRLLDTEGDERRYLFDELKAARPKARKSVHIPAGGGRKERTAEVCVRAGTYRLMPPRERKRRGEPREVNVVWVLEEAAPKGEEPLEWILLTSEPIATRKQVLAVVEHYCGRWKIEEWHKAIKTGCRMEQRQLRAWGRLEVLLGIFSVMGWRLLVLRDAARHEELCPAGDVLTEIQKTILQQRDPSLKDKNDAKSYLRAIAKLGGFLGRRSDGDPGWITLWRGYTRLLDMEAGFLLGADGESCG